MKKAMNTVALGGIVVLFIAAMFAISLMQAREKTEKGFFGKLLSTILGKEEERIEVGVTAGLGCPPALEITGKEMLAQAVMDCWVRGKQTGSKIQCCHAIDPKKVQGKIDKADLWNELQGKGIDGSEASNKYVWGIGTQRIVVNNKTVPFIICYDTSGWNEIYLTYTPTLDCK